MRPAKERGQGLFRGLPSAAGEIIDYSHQLSDRNRSQSGGCHLHVAGEPDGVIRHPDCDRDL